MQICVLHTSWVDTDIPRSLQQLSHVDIMGIYVLLIIDGNENETVRPLNEEIQQKKR